MDERTKSGLDFLKASQNRDGGWAYQPGGDSSPEPTCYALMALPSPDGVRWLTSLVRGAALTLPGDNEPHWTTSLAVLALRDEPSWATRLAEWLLTWEGRTLALEDDIEQDGRLRGWPWMSDTFSWVEPTSYALLALKRTGYRKHLRVIEGEQMLRDRMGADGGWNYGNPKVMGAELPAFVPTTALAALALQDVVTPSALAFLDGAVREHPSALSLALTILCFDAFARPTNELAEMLARRQQADGSWQGQVHLTALAVLALQAATGGGNVFRL